MIDNKILALKYRPQDFKDLIGQEVMTQTITNAINLNKTPNAYLLTGIRGVGKTTTARLIAKSLNCLKNIDNKKALKQAENLLERVEIQNANKVLNYYPHQLSGGMLQRAMIAMALSCEPKLLIADEPTTALDVTVQAQILQLLTDIQQETNMSFVMITHDLGVIAETVDRVLVMYSGKIMENSNVFDIFNQPKHPYTKALIDSIPGKEPGKKRLKEISKEDRDLWYAGT